jgi:phasin
MSPEQIDAGADTPIHPPHIDIPEGVKLAAASSLDQIKERLAKFKTNADAVSGAVEKSYSMAITDTAGLHMKMLEAIRANLTASFEFAGELAAAKSFPEMVSASTRFSRRQFEAFTAQWKDFWSFGQKMLADTAKPVASRLSRGIDQTASS